MTGRREIRPTSRAALYSPSPPPPKRSVFWPASPAPTSSLALQVLGALYPVFGNPASVARVVATFRRHYPTSPIVLVSDGGLDFAPLCIRVGHCTWRQHRHLFDRNATYARSSHEAIEMVSRYLSAFRDLASAGATHALLLEDDVRVLRPFTQRFDAAISGFIPRYLLSFYPPTTTELRRAGWTRAAADAQPYGGFGGCVYDVGFWSSAIDEADVRGALGRLASLGLFASDILLTTLALTHPRGCKPPAGCGRVAQLLEYTDALNYRREHVSAAASGRAAVVHHYKREYGDAPSAADLALLGWASYPPPVALPGAAAAPAGADASPHPRWDLGAIFDAVNGSRPAAAVRSLQSFRRHYPSGPLVILGEVGAEPQLAPLCRRLGRCAWRTREPGAHAAAVLPGLAAAVADLAATGATHALILREDVRVLRPVIEAARVDAALTAALPTRHVPPSLADALVAAGWTRDGVGAQRLCGLGGAVLDASFWPREVDAPRIARALPSLDLTNAHPDAVVWALALVLGRRPSSSSELGCSSLESAVGGEGGRRCLQSTDEIVDLSARRDYPSQAREEVRRRQATNAAAVLSGRAAVVAGFAAELDDAPTQEEAALLA